MTKKQFNRIITLYKDGLSIEVCLIAIIDICNNSTKAALEIKKFYDILINDNPRLINNK